MTRERWIDPMVANHGVRPLRDLCLGKREGSIGRAEADCAALLAGGSKSFADSRIRRDSAFDTLRQGAVPVHIGVQMTRVLRNLVILARSLLVVTGSR